MDTFLYFAYGSNMSEPRLRERLGRIGERLLERRHGVLRDYRLVFDKVASRTPTVGFANVVPDPGAKTEGTLNRVTARGLKILDEIEIVPTHYVRTDVQVVDSATGRTVPAVAYVGHPSMVRPALRPTRDYMAHLFAGGDVLSAGYLAELQAVSCWE